MEQTGREGSNACAEPGTHLHPAAQEGRAARRALPAGWGETCPHPGQGWTSPCLKHEVNLLSSPAPQVTSLPG